MPSSLKLRDIYNEIKVHQPGAKTVEDLNKLLDSIKLGTYSFETYKNIVNKHGYSVFYDDPANDNNGLRTARSVSHWITTLSLLF